MIAKLEFSLPEEQHEHETALKGADAFIVIQAVDNYLRDRQKYHDEKTIKIDTLRNLIHGELEERNIGHLV